MHSTYLWLEKERSSTSPNYFQSYRNAQQFPFHLHPNFEILYVKEGAINMRIQNQDYRLQSGQAIIVFPYQIHNNFGGTDDFYGISCSFSPNMVREFYSNVKNMIPVNPVFSPPRELRDVTFHNLEMLDPAYLKPVNVYLQKAHLYFITAFLSQKIEMTEKNNINISVLERTITFIQEHISEPLTLRLVAEAIGYEYYYFSRFFNQHFSCSFLAFLNEQRLYLATELLKDSNLTSHEIAERCGYQTTRTFNRNFVRSLKVTPTQYRRKTSKNPEL